MIRRQVKNQESAASKLERLMDRKVAKQPKNMWIFVLWISLVRKTWKVVYPCHVVSRKSLRTNHAVSAIPPLLVNPSLHLNANFFNLLGFRLRSQYMRGVKDCQRMPKIAKAPIIHGTGAAIFVTLVSDLRYTASESLAQQGFWQITAIWMAWSNSVSVLDFRLLRVKPMWREIFKRTWMQNWDSGTTTLQPALFRPVNLPSASA